MLLFKKKFLDPIRQGEKTQTIRLWKRCQMRPGQRSYIPGIGYISILSVDPVEIEQLTDADALPDGFESAVLLKNELHSLYEAQIDQGYRAYRVRFSVFPPDEQHRMREEKKRLKEEKLSNEKRTKEQREKEHVERTLAKLHHMAVEGHCAAKNRDGKKRDAKKHDL